MMRVTATGRLATTVPQSRGEAVPTCATDPRTRTAGLARKTLATILQRKPSRTNVMPLTPLPFRGKMSGSKRKQPPIRLNVTTTPMIQKTRVQILKQLHQARVKVKHQ